MSKVSFVCTTYRRLTCVERIVAQYDAQLYPDKELIIFNTDMEYPMSKSFEDDNIIIVNNNTDYKTGEPYTNRGAICRDAVTHATGEYFMLADDDDIYMPWHMLQAVEKIQQTGKDAWKPGKSFFASQQAVSFAQNTLEASVIVKMNRIREIGFRTDVTGYEGLSWYTKLRDEGQLNEYTTDYVPSYCFNWSDPADVAGHKQSGNIDGPDNFEQHKAATRDHAIRPLQRGGVDLDEVYKKYYDFFREHSSEFSAPEFQKYVAPHLEPAVPTEFPPLFEQAKGLAKTMWEARKLSSNGVPFRVPDEVGIERLAICLSCDQLEQDSTRCKQCGCIMTNKTRISAAVCPLKKWKSYEVKSV